MVGASVGAATVGDAVVGAPVVGCGVGAAVVGTAVVGSRVGAAVVGTAVVGSRVGAAVVGPGVGASVGPAVVGLAVGVDVRTAVPLQAAVGLLKGAPHITVRWYLSVQLPDTQAKATVMSGPAANRAMFTHGDGSV